MSQEQLQESLGIPASNDGADIQKPTEDLGINMLKKQGISEGYGQLTFAVSSPWQREKSLHTTDEYFDWRAKRLNAVPAGHWATCYFCGFPDDIFLELHHLNGNHKDYSDENLVFACSLCHRLHHLGWVGTENLGKLIYLPPFDTEKSGLKTNLPIGQTPKMELVNLLQRYLMLKPAAPGAGEGYDWVPRSTDEQKRLEMLPIAKAFKEISMLVNSSGMQNIYVKELLAREKKAREARDRLVKQNEDGVQSEPDIDDTHSGDGKSAKNKSVSVADIANALSEEATEDPARDSIIMSAATKNKQGAPKTDESAEPPFYSYAAESLHLLDIVQLLDELDEEFELEQTDKSGGEKDLQKPSETFFLQQKQGDNGVFIVEFRSKVLEPWHPALGYTLEERLDFYKNTLGYTSMHGILNAISDEKYKAAVSHENGVGVEQPIELFIEHPFGSEKYKGLPAAPGVLDEDKNTISDYDSNWKESTGGYE